MPELFITEYGVSLGKKSERLVVKEKGQVVEEVPFRDITQITIASSGVSISADVIRECVECGVQINFLTSTGKPYARLTAPSLTGTVITRREQILAYRDGRGLYLSKCFVEGKLKNQANLIKYFAKYRRNTDTVLYEDLQAVCRQLENAVLELGEIEGENIDEVRPRLFSVEGRAALQYWGAVALLLRGHVEFTGREHRGAADPVNAALNYGYGILYGQIWGAVMLAGLEPFAGFLHTDRPGKPSLVLDLTEEFRPAVVDRAIVSFFTRGGTIAMEDEKLSQGSRREIARRVLERLDGEENYDGKKHKVRTIIQMQSRRLASYLRGEGKYRPFLTGW
ncbi:MAG TPA: CRISPR-associated endonuclease Cas1 [Desulfotomaculum sp.]|nr:CRISPR-associated endonuclease Cas1 [Desulfotomaculum sp.]